MQRLPVFYLSHGGGPWPYLDGPMRLAFHGLEVSLKALLPALEVQPRAFLVITAHWETPSLRISSAAKPEMLYDYSGFPEHTYHVKYPAPGNPELAGRLNALLASAGFEAALDAERGFDHGTFSLLEVMRPEADIPVVQLSIRQDYDPAFHIALGRVLSSLRYEGVLIIGSGFSFHNLAALNASGAVPSAQFDGWLRDALLGRGAADREQALLAWERAPSARFAHPREDHLIPLMVAAGAGEDSNCELAYHEDDLFGNISASSFRFG